FQGMFFLGHRKQAGATERVGAAVVKRGYDVDLSGHRLVPRPEPAAVVAVDVPENRAGNEWTADGDVALDNANTAGGGGEPALRVQATGAPGARVTQTIAADGPVAGQWWSLSFWARSETGSVPIAGARLEAGEATVCTLSPTLTPTLTRYGAS